MGDTQDTLSRFEQLKAQLEIVDKNDLANTEKEFCILAQDLLSIDKKELHEEADELTRLVTELGNIEKREFSFMKILGIEKNELVHSSFLAWILNPLETHGLGSQFTKAFLEKATSKAKNMDLSEIDLSNLLVQTEVSMETSRLDIRLVDPTGQFVCVIENKVLSKEGNDQTKRLYRDNHNMKCPKELFIFLTLSGKEKPKDTHFLSLTYGEILPVLRELLSCSSDNTKHLMENYVNTLERLIVSERFDGYSERTQLYFRFNKQIDEVEAAFEQDRKLILSALEEEVKHRKWWDDAMWDVEKTGTEISVWKDEWYCDENEDEGPCFVVQPSTARPVVFISLLGHPSAFSQKFAPILEKHLAQEYPGKIPGNFRKTLTGVSTFLERTLLFSLTEKELIQKTLTSLDEMVNNFGKIVEGSIKEFRKK